MELITQKQIDRQVRINQGTSKTQNETFDGQGYMVVKNLINFEELLCKLPKERGQITYFGKLDKFQHVPIEPQVEGSISRYYYPPHKQTYYQVKHRIEGVIGKTLAQTYYYDRFYFPGQSLKKHVDRDACEISVSIHVGTNIKEPWAFKLIDAKGVEKELFLSPGDGLLYKGCEICHWRDPMPGERLSKVRKWLGFEELWYHQVFMHYVLSDGLRVQCANDMARC